METATVLVSVHFGSSGGSDLFAFWNDGVGSSCSSNQIEVDTYALGAPSLPSNNISFSVVVI